MKSNNYKILVLSDLKSATNSTLKSAVNLAKLVNGDLDFFHVKKATEIVSTDSQLSAMRTINESHTKTRVEIKQLLDSVSKEYDIKISRNHAFGNIKNEISEYIKATNPDIIVIGQRKSRSFKIAKNSITDLVIKEHNGITFVASEQNTFEPNKDFSLGVLNEVNGSNSKELIDSLISQSSRPLKSFNISNTTDVADNNDSIAKKGSVNYVFEKSDNAISTISNYLSKNNIDLLYLNKQGGIEKNSSDKNKFNIHEVITKMKTSLLIAS